MNILAPPSRWSRRNVLSVLALAMLALSGIRGGVGTATPSLQSFKTREAFSEALTRYQTDIELRRGLVLGDSKESTDLLGQSHLDTSCLHVLQNLTNYFISNNETVEHIIRNSGKDYNDLGRYYDCINTREDFRYILASVPNALPIGVSVGLCVPKVCTV